MADINYGMFPELNKANDEVLADPDEYEKWEKLVRLVEDLEGGLHRNSSPQAIDTARNVYNRFLAKFPLFFGFWKKYADLEFALAGSESADFIYERAVGSVGSAPDIWTNYCTHKTATCHDHEINRELFERGAETVGLDFFSHPFWDKYIEYEERNEEPARVFAILGRIIEIPLHQYARYFEKYRAMAPSMPVSALAPAPVIAQLGADSTRMAQMHGGSPVEIDRDMRSKLDQIHLSIFNRTQAEVTKRWTYEQEIKRLYFHVTELDGAEITNWHKYLDFEEAEGDFARTSFLYERCVVACAHYDEFWFRYARWMNTQENKVEETRNIFERASCYYLPVAHPEIRFQWALFEEANSRPDVAADIYQGVLIAMPDHFDALTRFANLKVRHVGVEEAVAVYHEHLTNSNISPATRGKVISALAHLAYQSRGDAQYAQDTFSLYKADAVNSETFWYGWLEFMRTVSITSQQEADYHSAMRGIYQDIRANEAALTKDEVKRLTKKYMQWLTERGNKETAAKEYLELDAFIEGSAVVVPVARGKLETLVSRQKGGSNGL
ncbi:Pre-mRNA-processing factor 39-like protein [Elsinoe fawcettii]|nr:Pre-mRNA-processing factor 39-like protein [Elsinoe fawcettii]